MKKTIFSLFAAALFTAASSFAVAASIFDITFPVAELGNCANQAECKAYCDITVNQDACTAFAKARGFISQERANKEKDIDRLAAQGGPGGCTSREGCRAYCADAEHRDECIAFAETHGLIESKQAKTLQELVAQGGPGGCKSEEGCKAFCADPANQDACLQFAAENNLISKDELAKIKKFKDIAAQGGPGNCTNQADCRAYCADASHQDECIAFAKAHGLINKEEAKMMERGRELSKKVEELGGPGGCKSEQDCRAYCANPDNVDACLAFAVEHGGFKQEEAQLMMREFIRQNAHQDGTSTEDMMQMEQHMQQFQNFRDMEEKFRKPEFLQQGQITGPGGCKGPQECMQYCADPSHRDECAQFNPGNGNMPPGMLFKQGEPGGERQLRGLKPSRTPTIPFQGNAMPFRMMPPQQKGEGGAEGEQKFQVCTQEFKPVCGTDGRTYPNTCFAKNSNVTITKEGVCDSVNNIPHGMVPPQGFMPPEEGGMMDPMQYPSAPQPFMMPPPQSRRSAPDIFFGMILDAFKNLMPR